MEGGEVTGVQQQTLGGNQGFPQIVILEALYPLVLTVYHPVSSDYIITHSIICLGAPRSWGSLLYLNRQWERSTLYDMQEGTYGAIRGKNSRNLRFPMLNVALLSFVRGV